MKSRLSPRTPPIIRRTSAPVAFALLLIALGATPAWCQAGSGKPAKSKEQVEAGKEKNKESEAENALKAKYDAAVQEKNWPDAESTASQLIAQNLGKSNADLISTLYLTILSRLPSSAEMQKAASWIPASGSTRASAVQDLVWPLYNKVDFVFNY